jgi:SAM-dependent methyltransferase
MKGDCMAISDEYHIPTGYVEEVTKLAVSGWVTCFRDTPRPVVKLIQDGETICAIRPTLPAPNVIKALGLSHKDMSAFRWKLPFPLMAGLVPDINIFVCFEDGIALQKGKDIQIPLFEHIDSEAREDLEAATLLLPQTPTLTDGAVSVGIATLRSPAKPVSRIQCGKHVHQAVEGSNQIMHMVHGTVACEIRPEDFKISNEPFVKISIDAEPHEDERVNFHQSLRTLWIPQSVFQTDKLVCPVPGEDNIVRVSGIGSGLRYIISGTTTFMQLNEISKQYFSGTLDQFETVLDWGVGCARVMRQFWEAGPAIGLKKSKEQNIIGLDIDPINIEWSKVNMGNKGSYELLSLDGFDLADGEVDFLYGISVMTHLTEHNQYFWLEEIARVVKPGGCVILTVHGEFAYYRHPRMIATPFVERTGFYDSCPDQAIGKDRDTYYRATFHAREYLREHWTRDFEILDFIPVANAFLQDFVVMRRR